MRILTFLSDFGAASPYPAAMKAAAAAVADAVFVDISHEVPPQSIRGGAYLLWSVAPTFPRGTVHCAVVDPGVGTSRAALGVASGGQFFVGPDNGLLLPAARRCGTPLVYRLLDPTYWRTPVSSTFHGRDVFAPAAAYLAAGVPLERLGPPVPDPVRLPIPGSRLEAGALVGEVLDVDRFGNLLTSIEATRLGELPGSGPLRVEVAGHTIGGLVEAFAAGAAEAAAAIVGSTGRVEIFVRDGSAARRLGVGRGAPVRVRRAPEPG